MQLYFSPGACSLAAHVALHEAGADFDHVKVDLKAHRTEQDEDFYAINPKGYVPTLVLDGDAGTLTENVAVLDWIAGEHPALAAQGPLARTRLLEMLAFVSTELHKSFAPFFQGGGDAEKQKAGDKIAKRFQFVAERLDGDYLFGNTPTVADAYLLVMLFWATRLGLPIPEPLPAFLQRMMARPAVATAL